VPEGNAPERNFTVSTSNQHEPGSHTHAQQHDPLYRELANSPDFKELKSRYRGFVLPWTVAFLSWYLLFVILSNWAPDFMSKQVIGNINLGLVLGLLQFASTFAIAWIYARYAAAKFDPLAKQIKERYDSTDAGENA
jgi:uncharacterized membrane protein (DUF485 family)